MLTLLPSQAHPTELQVKIRERVSSGSLPLEVSSAVTAPGKHLTLTVALT